MPVHLMLTFPQMSLITQSIFAPAVALTKVSICIGYLHLFPTPNSIRFSYILIGILIAYGASSFVVVVVQCMYVSFGPYIEPCLMTIDRFKIRGIS